MYPMTKAVEVHALEYGKPLTLHLGTATDGFGRTLFGVRDRYTRADDDGSGELSHMCYAVGDGFDPVQVLQRVGPTGWFVFHSVTQLKVSALELEVAFYRLGLIEHMGDHLVRTPAEPSPATPPDQVLVNSKDLEDVLDTFTKGQAAQEGDPLARLRRVVWEHTAAKARQSMTEKVQGEGTA